MKFYRTLRSGLVAVAISGAALSLEAQSVKSSDAGRWIGPLTVEGYYTHYRLDTNTDDRFGMSGIGGRLMWSGSARAAGVGSLPSRAAVGVFAEYAPTQDRGFAILHAGAQGDLRLTSSPLFGRVEPMASLAAGALWVDVDNQPKAELSGFPLAGRGTTTFALTPSIGTRVNLWRELGLRLDLRDVMTFRNAKALHNYQFASGLSFAF